MIFKDLINVITIYCLLFFFFNSSANRITWSRTIEDYSIGKFSPLFSIEVRDLRNVLSV